LGVDEHWRSSNSVRATALFGRIADCADYADLADHLWMVKDVILSAAKDLLLVAQLEQIPLVRDDLQNP
jgi:hypothetical protein